MALPGVLGEGSPDRCQGAPERTPGAGEGSSWKVAPWLPELSPAPVSGMAGGGGHCSWRGAHGAPGPPMSARHPWASRSGGWSSAGQLPAPAPRLLRRERETGRRASLQKCRPGAGSGGPGHRSPRQQAGIPRRFAQRVLSGEPPATLGHEAEVPKTKDPTLKPLLAKSQRAESISPESFPPPPAELRAGPVAPSRGSGAAAGCGRGSEQGRAAALLCRGRSGTSPGRGEGGVEP